MDNIVLVTPISKWAAKLGAPVRSDGCWPTHKVEPCGKNVCHCFSRLRLEPFEQGKSRPSVDTQEMLLSPEVKEIEADLGHRRAKRGRGGRGD